MSESNNMNSYTDIFFEALTKAAANKILPKVSTLNQWANDARAKRWTEYKPPVMKGESSGIRKTTQTTGLLTKFKSWIKPK